MKKTTRVVLIALFVIGLAACSTPAATTTPSAATAPESGFVTFTDPVLEAMVRGSMGKLEGDITLAEARAVTRMDLDNELQQYLPQGSPIQELSGLENFTNLESLDLSSQAVADISALQGLTRLTSLSLAGNPVSDISPLAGLTNLQILILSNSQAQDYSALANLVNLQVLLLDNSTITDLTPLTSLTNLQTLYLANCAVDDLSPLQSLYANLVTKDFLLPSTLADLGFSMDGENHKAYYDSEEASFIITHEAWGTPPEEDNQNIIRMSMYLESGYKVSIGYYDVHQAYVIQMDVEGQPPVNYLYFIADGSYSIGPEDRAITEQAILKAMEVMEGEDILYAPVRFFNDAIKNTFKMTPEKLFTLPFEPPTLMNLGFVPDETAGIYEYEQHEGIYTNILIDHTDNAEKEFDIVFFQPISDEYRVNMYYFVPDKRLIVRADDNYQGGASFILYMDTGEHIDEWCSDNSMTVNEYYIKAYNDPTIEDVYAHTADLMVQYIQNKFGMTLDDLYALPIDE